MKAQNRLLYGILIGVIIIGIMSLYFVSADVFESPEVLIDYKDDNMTIEFKEGLEVIGEATLKSHITYDEVLEITIGEDKTIIWYEFSDFKDIQLDALKGVEFIDMREMIENKSYIKQFEENPEKMNDSLVLIPNPNYLLPIEKDYKFVYKNGNEWIDYNLKDIPKENIIIGVQTDLFWGELIDVRLNVFDNKLDRHALVLGTSAGFVTEAPTGDPGGSSWINAGTGYSYGIKVTSSATANKITEIGWWCNRETTNSNFEVGLYSDNGAGEPNLLLEVDRPHSKGTTTGWKVVTGLDWEISPDTIYWIVWQLDDSSPDNSVDYASSGGNGMAIDNSVFTLSADWGSSFYKDGDGLVGIYAVYEAEAGDCWTVQDWGIFIPTDCVFKIEEGVTYEN